MSSGKFEAKPSKLGIDLIDQLAFYGEYHNNPYNQLIHVIFVPILWLSFDVLLTYAGDVYRFSSLPIINEPFVVDWSFLFFACYAVFYSLLDQKAGLSFSFVLFGLHRLARYVVDRIGQEDVWKFALAAQALGWYMQIHPGHAILEKRKPALLDSLHQSLLMAPLFVWYETLFFFGYDKEFKKRLDANVNARIARWKKESAKA